MQCSQTICFAVVLHCTLHTNTFNSHSFCPFMYISNLLRMDFPLPSLHLSLHDSRSSKYFTKHCKMQKVYSTWEMYSWKMFSLIWLDYVHLERHNIVLLNEFLCACKQCTSISYNINIVFHIQLIQFHSPLSRFQCIELLPHVWPFLLI